MTTANPTLEDLPPDLVEEVRRLPAEQLVALKNYLLDLEIERLVTEVDRQADEDRAVGKLDAAAIDAAIRDHRVRKPYP